MSSTESTDEHSGFTSWLVWFEPGSRIRNLIVALVYIVLWPLGIVLIVFSLIKRHRGSGSQEPTESSESEQTTSTASKESEDASDVNQDLDGTVPEPLPLAEERREIVYITGKLFGSIPVFGGMVYWMLRLYRFCINIWYRVFHLLGADSELTSRFQADTQAIVENFDAGYRGDDQPGTQA